MLAAIPGTVTLLSNTPSRSCRRTSSEVIAYSTMSQIGYMFLGAGVGAYAAGDLPFAMHAFFKALLFMRAGIVIHYLSGEQDMRKMGGLKDHLPKTWLAFPIGSLALWASRSSRASGRDPIVAAALYDGGPRPLGIAGLVGAFLAGLYTFRMFFLVWYGEPSPEVRAAAEHPRGGRCPGRARLAGGGSRRPLHHRRLPAGARRVELVSDCRSRCRAARPPARSFDWLSRPVRRAVGLAGTYVAYLIYEAHRRGSRQPGLQRTLEQRFWFDELYDALFYRPAEVIALWLRDDVETTCVEGRSSRSSAGEEAGAGVARIQSGLLRVRLAIAVTVVVLAIVFVSLR